jgi:hypothetical protein
MHGENGDERKFRSWSKLLDLLEETQSFSISFLCNQLKYSLIFIKMFAGASKTVANLCPKALKHIQRLCAMKTIKDGSNQKKNNWRHFMSKGTSGTSSVIETP